MYHIIIYIYALGVAVASFFSEKVKTMRRGERDALRVLKDKVDPNARYLWFHAASLGEFEQGRPLMERIRSEHPEYRILLTFFSPSGYEVRKNYEGADIICYLPLDTWFNARRFLSLVHPEAAFFIKYEFWWNYLARCHKLGIPVYSVSSIFRPSQIFFRWYGHHYRRVLHCVTRFFVQNELSSELLAGIGLHNVEVVGDTRFDRVLQIKQQARRLPVVDAFTDGSDKVFVAGSSWQPDEEIFLRWFGEHKGWKLIIAPHVIGEEHLVQIETLCKKHNLATLRYKDCEEAFDKASLNKADVLIVNCFGLLSSIYGYGNVSYVGGGFGVGIHNVLEAAVWDMPVIFGPNNQRFQEAQQLKACGGGKEISCYDDFVAIMDAFEADPHSVREAGDRAGRYVESTIGATDAVLSAVGL